MAPMKCPAHRHLADEEQESVSLTHLAHRWHVPRRKVKRLLQSGALPFEQVAGQIRVPVSAIVALETKGSAHA